MKKLKKDQRGITMVEMVIAFALTGIVTASIIIATLQVININTSTSNRMTAVSQVQQAGKLVSEDILEAQSVNAGVSSGFPLTLTWTECEPPHEEHEVTYTLEDGELYRSESVNGGDPTVTRVAEYIDPDQTNCAPLGVLPAGQVLTFTVTATVGGQSETRVYEVTPRPGSQ